RPTIEDLQHPADRTRQPESRRGYRLDQVRKLVRSLEDCRRYIQLRSEISSEQTMVRRDEGPIRFVDRRRDRDVEEMPIAFEFIETLVHRRIREWAKAEDMRWPRSHGQGAFKCGKSILQ